MTSEALALAALGATGLVMWYSMLQVLPAEAGADGKSTPLWTGTSW